MKHPRVESLEKRLLAEHARLRDDLAAEHDWITADAGSEAVGVELADIAQIEKALLALNATPVDNARHGRTA